MTVRSEPLFAFTDALGIERRALTDVENPNRLAGTFQTAGIKVPTAVSPEALDALAAEYGNAVTFVFRIGALDEFTYDHGSYSAEALSRFVAGADRVPQYDLLLEVEKISLIARALDGAPPCEVVLYFTGGAATAALRRDIPTIEKDLWPDTARRLLILTLDSDIHLSGDSLSIVGGVHLDAARQEATLAPIDSEMAVRAALRRDDYIGWDTKFAGSLTPWHFFIEKSDDSALASYVDAAFMLMAVLFTCDRARSITRSTKGPCRNHVDAVAAAPAAGQGTLADDRASSSVTGPRLSTIQAEFRSRDHVAFVPISDGEPFSDLSVEERKAVRALLDWCYQTQTGEPNSPDWLADRLPFVQVRVAQALEGRPEETRFHAFAQSMPEIYQGAQWQWRAFLEGRVSEYLDKVQDLERAVSDTVDQCAEKTTALAKSLSDTMLAAVAALIGSFIAAAFHQPFDARLFRIGLLVYAAYVAIFPGTLGLLSSNGQAVETKRSFDAKRRHFKETLYQEKVDEIVGTRIRDAECRYQRWLYGVALGYFAVTMAAVVGAYVIPHHIGNIIK